MAASQSGVFSLQEFSDLGALLNNGRLYTYVYGTTTQKTAYTDIAGLVPHTYTSDGIGGQYIALNARGELPAPLYLTTGSYDLALKRADGSTVWTRRADPIGDIPVSLSNVTGVLPVANGGTGGSTPITARAGLGVAPRATRIDVASVAGTVNLTTSAPDTDDIQITGALSITAFTVATDRVLRVRAAGGFTLTNNANIVTQTGGNITASTGDTFMLRATAANVVEVLGYTQVSQPSVKGTSSNLQASASGFSATINVSADELVLENGVSTFQLLRSVALSLSGAVSGAGGLDTGALAINTWYSLWVIWNGSTTAGLLSLSASAPTMPAGYTHKARVGYIRTDGTANKYPLGFKQYGKDVQWIVAAASNVPTPIALAFGTAGNVSTPSYIPVAVAPGAPPTASKVRVWASAYGAQTVLVAPNASYGNYNSTATNVAPITGEGQATFITSFYSEFLLESANIYWASAGASNYLFIMGYTDNL